MKILKKFLFYIIMIMTFALSFSSEDAKIYLDRKIEPAKLKIGVTKLKTKELPLDFNIEEKTIFGYLPDSVTDNHLIFISETLDEMPSLSTTNGRRSINNIKKYLTKDIKVAPKFTYQVLVGDKENGIEEGKKYLLINCKTVLSGVYVYVVERDTYHVKEVYKGKFNVPTTLEERTTYGIITVGASHQLGSGGIIYYDDSEFTYDGLKVNYITLSGEYPEKYVDSSITKVKVSVGAESCIIDYSNGAFETPESGTNALKIRNLSNLGVGIIQIYAKDSNDVKNIAIKLSNLAAEVETNSEIKIEYGVEENGKFIGKVSDTFKFIIEKNGTQTLTPTNGGLYLYAGHGAIQVKLENGSVSGTSKYKVVGSIPKTITKEDITKIKDDYEDIYLKIKINGEEQDINPKIGEDDNKHWFWWLTAIKDQEKWREDKYKLNDGYIIKGEFYTSTGVIENQDIANLNITSSLGQNITFELTNINKFGNGSINIQFQYIGKIRSGLIGGIGGIIGISNEKILKEDTFTISLEGEKEVVPEDRDGTLVIYDLTNTKNLVLTSNNDTDLKNISTDSIGKAFNVANQAYLEGEFPLNFNIEDNNSINWGSSKKIIVSFSPATSSGIGIGDIKQEITTNNFETDPFRMVTVKEKKNVGRIIVNKTSDNLGVKFYKQKDNSTEEVDLLLEEGDSVNGELTIEYQAKYGSTYYTKRKDTLAVRLEREEPFTKAEIVVNNPIVMYDYTSMNPYNHYRRIHLSSDETQTLDRDGSKFNKNTTLKGNQWIDTKDISGIPDYDYQNLKNHRIRISSSGGETVKSTDVNGKTHSSTFINLNGSGNQVMFSYDGGNKYMNFGVSKYNFKGGIGKVKITHYKNNDIGTPVSSVDYTIKLPEFNGIPYLDPNCDISPNQDYIKTYSFDQSLGTNPITIDYGTVGFKDLDTRITEQSGGEGITLKLYTDVKLVHESGAYIIEGAKLYFESDESNIEYFKGTNELATSKKLKLYIPSQEKLIAPGKYRVLSDEAGESSGGISSPGNPLKVGVVVNGDNTSYFKDVTSLYLEIKDGRLITTELIFQNENLSDDIEEWNNNDKNPTAEKWIKLNKSNYPSGRIENYSGDSWGKVKGDVIDIPWAYEYNGQVIEFENLKMTVLDSNYKPISDQNFSSENGGEVDLNIEGKKLKLKLPNNNETNYIQFWLGNYPSDLFIHDFYIRYEDEGKGYLFTQRYIIKLEKTPEVILNGTTNIILKNPIMLTQANTDIGMIEISNNSPEGKVLSSEDNSETYDPEKWWEVTGEFDFSKDSEIAMHYDYYYSLTSNGDKIELDDKIVEIERVDSI